MKSDRYRQLLADLRSGCVVQWDAPRATLDHIIRRAAETLWPQLAETVDRRLQKDGAR